MTNLGEITLKALQVEEQKSDYLIRNVTFIVPSMEHANRLVFLENQNVKTLEGTEVTMTLKTFEQFMILNNLSILKNDDQLLLLQQNIEFGKISAAEPLVKDFLCSKFTLE